MLHYRGYVKMTDHHDPNKNVTLLGLLDFHSTEYSNLSIGEEGDK